jgi:glycosyltransferase 2 family protein
LKKTITYLISVSLAFGLCYWAFKGINLQEIFGTFQQANIPWVMLGFVFTFFSHAFRGIRWKLLLEPLEYKAGVWSCISAVLIGYASNLILPRAGEFARAASLQKMENISSEKSFGTIVAERLVDVLALGVLFVLTMLLEFEKIKGLLAEMTKGSTSNNSKIAIVLTLGSLVLIFLYLYRKKISEFLQKITFFQKIWKLVSGFKDGLLSILKIKKLSLFILYTFGIWFMYYAVTYCLLRALPIGSNITLTVTLSVLVIGSVGMAVPSLGGLGSFHLLVSAILVQYGYSKTDGLTLATFQHTLNGLIFVIFLGLLGFLYSIFKTETK